MFTNALQVLQSDPFKTVSTAVGYFCSHKVWTRQKAKSVFFFPPSGVLFCQNIATPEHLVNVMLKCIVHCNLLQKDKVKNPSNTSRRKTVVGVTISLLGLSTESSQ